MTNDTIKAKGDELIERFIIPTSKEDAGKSYISKDTIHRATQCAIIAVEEIIAYQNIMLEKFGADADGYTPKYWNEVLNYLKQLG